MIVDEKKHLLRLKSEDALNVMLTNANNVRYPIHDLKASKPETLGPTKTKVVLTARDRAASDDTYRIEGSTDFTYQRLDINVYFAGLLDSFEPTLPSTTQVLLNEITNLTGIEFEIEDFEHRHITRENAESFKLKAKVESLRWVGEIELSIGNYLNVNSFNFGSFSYIYPNVWNSLTKYNSFYSPFINVTNWQLTFNVLAPAFPSIGYSKMEHLPIALRIKLALPIQAYGYGDVFDLVERQSPPYRLLGANVRLVDVTTLKDEYDGGISYNLFDFYSLFSNQITKAFEIAPVMDDFNPPYYDLFYLLYAEHELKDIPIRIGAGIKQNGLSPYDGSAYNNWFSSLVMDTYIASFPGNVTAMKLDPKYPNKTWQMITTDIDNRNLFMAFVRYNGPKRIQDNNSIYPNLTNVAELILHPKYCISVIGSIKVYYS